MKVSGWLIPSGKFIECQSSKHLEMVREHAIFIQKVPEIQGLLDDLDRTAKECEEAEEREGYSNAEWHQYDFQDIDCRFQIWRLLLNAGFIRVGESNDQIHFEGRPNVLKSNHQRCIDFADSYGAVAVFEPRR